VLAVLQFQVWAKLRLSIVLVAVAAVIAERGLLLPARSLEILLQLAPSEIIDTESLAADNARVVDPSMVSVPFPSRVTAFVTSVALMV